MIHSQEICKDVYTGRTVWIFRDTNTEEFYSNWDKAVVVVKSFYGSTTAILYAGQNVGDREAVNEFYSILLTMGFTHVSYERVKNGKIIAKTFKIKPTK